MADRRRSSLKIPEPPTLRACPHGNVTIPPEFMARLAEINTVASRALTFTILTCARTSEVLHATWDEISFADAIWRVPASRMKMQKPHDVPLSEQALRLLGDQTTKNPYVFPGRPRAPAQ
jgi:integrase